MEIIRKIKLNFLAAVNIVFKNTIEEVDNSFIEGIVFSMDRPLQLYALLESYFKHCIDPGHLFVIYKCTSQKYDDGYMEIVNYYKDRKISFVRENSFQPDLLAILNRIESKYLFFLVDDNIFKSTFSFRDYLELPNRDKYIFSLRLGLNLNRCYTFSKYQVLPVFGKDDMFFTWQWKRGSGDWNYVFSVDGNIFRTQEIRVMSNLISFKNPNSYEARMNVFRLLFRTRKGACYEKSVLINVCLNRVQNEIINIAGNFSPEELQEYWVNNKKIHVDYFCDIDNKSAHFEVENLMLLTRG